MKAMLLESHAAIENSPLVAVDLPDPEPGDGEVRIKVHCCGICRTDLHVIEGELAPQKLPIIPGHQIVGTIETPGRNCKRFRGGERVGVAWLRATCGVCEFCRTGKENLCPESRYTGYHADGGFAEYAVVNENYVYEIPHLFANEEAAPLLCAGIIGFRSLERSLLPHGGQLAIFGFGSSAHIVIQIALFRGCKVFVISRSQRHLALAKGLGANWVGTDTANFPGLVDSAIIFAPAGELVPEALEILKRGGTVSLAGIHMDAIPSLDYTRHLFFERNLHSVTANTRADGRHLLKLASEIPIRPHVRTYSLKEANRALQDLKFDRIEGTGVLQMQ